MYTGGNYVLDDIVTPIDVEKYQALLVASQFNPVLSKFLLDGFTRGFDIGYRGPLIRRNLSNNIPITIGTEQDILDKLMKEVKVGRHAGPYKEIPFKYFMQSPVGLVPKAGGQTRLIFHLSYDFGTEESDKSLNYDMPDYLCTVKYKDLDYAVQTILKLIAVVWGDGDDDHICGDDDSSNSGEIEQFCWSSGKRKQKIFMTKVT